MAELEVEAFLTVSEHVSASTQNRVLCALIFLYRYILKQLLAETMDAARAKRSQHQTSCRIDLLLDLQDAQRHKTPLPRR